MTAIETDGLRPLRALRADVEDLGLEVLRRWGAIILQTARVER